MQLNFKGHSIFSPSSAKMWLTCPGSLLANAAVRQKEGDTSSPEAREGTVAHEMAEIWLKTNRRPDDRLGDIIHDVEVTEEMLDYVEQYVRICQHQEGDKYVEERVDFSHLMPVPNQTGTSDHVCINGDTLTITDLKYGMGVKVDAVDNPQLRLYAIGTLASFDAFYDGIKYVRMRIVQPRLDRFSEETLTVEELAAFGEYVRERALLAWQPDAPRKPSVEACRWCRVQATCPAKLAEMEALVDEAFAEADKEEALANLETLEFPEPNELDIRDLAQVMLRADSVEAWLKKVRDRVFNYLVAGGKLDEFKLVAGRNTRNWQNEEEVRDFFRSLGLTEDDFAPRAFVSVAGGERLLKSIKADKTQLSRFVGIREGNPTIARADDKRPEWTHAGDVEFDSTVD